MSYEHQQGDQDHQRSSPLDPKKLLREAIAGGDSDYAAGGWQPPALAEIERRFPELDVVELIGRGGMGAVYRVVQRKLDRTVALKVLPPELAQDPAFEERFLREARALAGLKHERILTVHDFGQRDGLYYLVTEFVEGMNLRQLMNMGGLTPHEALRITPQICEALQYAHDHGVVHRDVKPENLLIDLAGEVRIADFGLARILGDASGPALTRSTQVLGTPQYMAPEQWRDGQNVDHRADIYAVGVVLYEMLTGQLPIGHFDPPSRRKGVPKGLDAVVQRSLAQRPEERFQQACDVSSELQRHPVNAPDKHSAASGHRSSVGARAAGEVVSGRVPGLLKAVWIIAALALIGMMNLSFQQYKADVEYGQDDRLHAVRMQEAHEWSSTRSDIAEGEDVLVRYFEDVLMVEWRARRRAAASTGDAFLESMPHLAQDPSSTGSIAMMVKLMFGVGVIGVLFPIFGFSSISILKRRRHRAGLGVAVFTAWLAPVAIVIGLAVGALNDNIRDNDTAVAVSAAAGIVLAIGGIVWMVYQFRRLAQSLA